MTEGFPDLEPTMTEVRTDYRRWRPAWAAPAGCVLVAGGVVAFLFFLGLTIMVAMTALVRLAEAGFTFAAIFAVTLLTVAHFLAVGLWSKDGRLPVLSALIVVGAVVGFIVAASIGWAAETIVMMLVLLSVHLVGFAGVQLVRGGEQLGSAVVWGRRALARGQCPACGYDIRSAVSSRCPECGQNIEFRDVTVPPAPTPPASRNPQPPAPERG